MTHELADAPTFEELAAVMREMPAAVCPVRHFFTPGLYSREITMPAGSIVLSMEHLTEHPFLVSQGVVEVIDSHGAAELLQAPHFGITRPGTRRLLRTLTETVWTTFHVTDKTTVEDVAAEILSPSPCPELEQWRLTTPHALA